MPDLVDELLVAHAALMNEAKPPPGGLRDPDLVLTRRLCRAKATLRRALEENKTLRTTQDFVS